MSEQKKTVSKKLKKRQVKLILPGYLKKESRLQSIATLENKCRELRHFPVQSLSEIYRYLQDLNRSKQSSARRFELIERYSMLVVPVVKNVFTRFHKSHPLPEDEEKRELLNLASNICNEMTIGYMRLFEHDVNLSKLRYNRTRERIVHSGHCIMEYAYAEQRLRSLRYQNLNVDTWKNLNLTFSVLYCFEDFRFQKQSLDILKIVPLATQNKKIEPAKSRIVSMYISIQLNACVDMFSMATQQSYIAASQVLQFANKLSVTVNLDVTNPEDYITTHSNYAGADGNGLSDEEVMEFSIDVSGFKREIKDKFEAIEKIVSTSGSSSDALDVASVSSQNDIELHIALANILHRLNLHERGEERRYIGHMDHLFIFNGYKPCFSIMATLRQDSANEGPELDTDMRDMLSQRSATIADDQSADESSKWLISNISAKGLLAETRETRFTNSMFVGQLLLYGIGEISSSEITLAYICRMHRDAGDKLQIAIVNLSKRAELVVVQPAQLQKSAMGLPGILLADYVDGLALVLHTSHRLQPGTSITLVRSKKHYSYSVGSITLIQREFTQYQLVTG